MGTVVPEQFQAIKIAYTFLEIFKQVDNIQAMPDSAAAKEALNQPSQSLAKRIFAIKTFPQAGEPLPKPLMFTDAKSKAMAAAAKFQKTKAPKPLPDPAIQSSIAVPGGWASRDIGHAIWYQWTMTLQGLLFTLTHSGAGLQYHERLSATDRERFYGSQTYRIPLPVDEKKLAAFLQSLLVLQCLNLREPWQWILVQSNFMKKSSRAFIFRRGASAAKRAPPTCLYRRPYGKHLRAGDVTQC